MAKYQNFTRAARAMGNSQPNITRAMNLLEQEIHCTLFIRTNRGVRLTPEGEKLYIRVSAAMEQLQTAEEELHESSGLEHGTISIGASETALNIYLLEKLRTFHMEYPGIRLKIYNHSTPQAVQAVKNGEIDFAVVTTPTDVETPLKKVDLYSFQEILVGGKTYGIGEVRNCHWQKFRIILLPACRETQTWKFYQQIFERHGLELLPDTEVATTDQILPLVKNELGMAFLPEAMAREAIEKGEIIELSLRESVPQRSVCMVYGSPASLKCCRQKN